MFPDSSFAQLLSDGPLRRIPSLLVVERRCRRKKEVGSDRTSTRRLWGDTLAWVTAQQQMSQKQRQNSDTRKRPRTDPGEHRGQANIDLREVFGMAKEREILAGRNMNKGLGMGMNWERRQMGYPGQEEAGRQGEMGYKDKSAGWRWVLGVWRARLELGIHTWMFHRSGHHCPLNPRLP